MVSDAAYKDKVFDMQKEGQDETIRMGKVNMEMELISDVNKIDNIPQRMAYLNSIGGDITTDEGRKLYHATMGSKTSQHTQWTNLNTRMEAAFANPDYDAKMEELNDVLASARTGGFNNLVLPIEARLQTIPVERAAMIGRQSYTEAIDLLKKKGKLTEEQHKLATNAVALGNFALVQPMLAQVLDVTTPEEAGKMFSTMLESYNETAKVEFKETGAISADTQRNIDGIRTLQFENMKRMGIITDEDLISKSEQALIKLHGSDEVEAAKAHLEASGVPVTERRLSGFFTGFTDPKTGAKVPGMIATKDPTGKITFTQAPPAPVQGIGVDDTFRQKTKHRTWIGGLKNVDYKVNITNITDDEVTFETSSPDFAYLLSPVRGFASSIPGIPGRQTFTWPIAKFKEQFSKVK